MRIRAHNLLRMNIRPIITAAELRAKAIGLSIDRLCLESEIDRSTWQRWKSGKCGPLLSKWMDVEDVLARHEQAAEAARDSSAS